MYVRLSCATGEGGGVSSDGEGTLKDIGGSIVVIWLTASCVDLICARLYHTNTAIFTNHLHVHNYIDSVLA